MTVVAAPVDWIEFVSELRLPANADRRLQELMERNNEGRLLAKERAELESLIEISETLALVRAKAVHLLGRTPQ
jgi:hypothetical protein